MTGVAVFLVKNGIGFGHIRRALLLAEHVSRRGELRPVVISQAHSLDLLRTAPVSVLNLPLLHRVPAAVTEDCYLEILEQVLQRLGPVVVIEDTYPDLRYGALRALRHVPRLLVLRRLDGESFDTLRKAGAFTRYDEILLAEDADDLACEGHSGDSLTVIQRSGVVQVVGNICHLPTHDEIAAVRASHGSPLVVVSGGAGGDQQPDGYGDRFLAACHRTAALLHGEGHPAQFVVVTGPYYAGRPLAPLPNLTVHRFTPQLPALLAAADVAVIKPGNNALSEALHGAANLVLVPDTAFLEGVSQRARYVTRRYGGVVVAPEQGPLEHAIRDALVHPPRTRRPSDPTRAIRRVVDAIHTHAATPAPTVLPKRLTVVLRPPPGLAPAVIASWIPHSAAIGGGVGLLSTADTAETIRAVLLADAPPRSGLGPQELVDAGAELLLSEGAARPAVERWLGLDPPRPTLLHATLQCVSVQAGEQLRPRRALAAALRDDTHAALLLDLRSLTDSDALELVEGLNEWISRQPVELVPVDCLRSSAATRLLREGTRAP